MAQNCVNVNAAMPNGRSWIRTTNERQTERKTIARSKRNEYEMCQKA